MATAAVVNKSALEVELEKYNEKVIEYRTLMTELGRDVSALRYTELTLEIAENRGYVKENIYWLRTDLQYYIDVLKREQRMKALRTAWIEELKDYEPTFEDLGLPVMGSGYGGNICTCCGTTESHMPIEGRISFAKKSENPVYAVYYSKENFIEADGFIFQWVDK